MQVCVIWLGLLVAVAFTSMKRCNLAKYFKIYNSGLDRAARRAWGGDVGLLNLRLADQGRIAGLSEVIQSQTMR